MAERKIVRGVRANDKTYTPGTEDELAKVLSAEEIERLTAKGYLEGTWISAKPVAEPAKSATKEK